MNKNELIELYNKNTKSPIVIKDYNNNTGIIIDEILPAVRDDEKFKQAFWEWMFKTGRSKKNGCVYTGYGGACRIASRLLLADELEFVKGVLSNE